MKPLLQVEEAISRILANLPNPKTELINVEDALGRVLATDIIAPIDLPPFANSSMDGFAVRSDDLKSGETMLRIVMDIPAGHNPHRPLQPGEAARIMTGAPIPTGADTVIPVEATNQQWGVEDAIQLNENVIIQQKLPPGSHIRQQGENIQAGATVLTAKTRIRPQDIGMLVGLGIIELNVYKKPLVIVLSTGDELVGPDEPLTPGKIRDTNSYTIAAMITEQGGVATRLKPAADNISAVTQLFQQAIQQQPDLIVSTAGVSVGTYDVVRSVLESLGEMNFWRVNVRPGKPLAFGMIAGIPFFGLPGNPVSAMITFDIFVNPALAHLSGIPTNKQQIHAITGEAFESDGRRTYVRVTLDQDSNQRIIARSTGTQSSGALMSMVLADGLLIIPDGVRLIPQGQIMTVRLLRDPDFEI